jgi:hypothetical protein
VLQWAIMFLVDDDMVAFLQVRPYHMRVLQLLIISP